VGGGGDKALSPVLTVGRLTPPALVNAAREPDLLDETAALNDANAVLADIDAVGGPDAKIDLMGGSNMDVEELSPYAEPCT
jgi:hypothetical protein